MVNEYSDDAQHESESPYERFWALSLDMLCIAGMDGYFKMVNPAFQKTLGYSPAELLAQPFVDLVHPEDRAATLAEIEKLGTGMPTIFFENRYRCADGTYKWLAWNAFPYPVEERIYAVARDISDKRRAEAEHQQLLSQEQLARRENEVLARVSRRISASEDLEQVLQILVESAHELVQADLTQIAIPVAPGILQVVALVGQRTDRLHGFVLRPGTGVVGRVMETGEPYQVEDYASAHEIVHDPLLDEAVTAEGGVSVLGIPIRRDAETLGVFWVYARTRRHFTTPEVDLLRRLGTQAAVAMEHARVQSQGQSARAELLAAERREAILQLTRQHEQGKVEGIAIQLQPGACEVCQNAAREIYTPRLLPPLPLAGCTSTEGCRCMYTAPGFDPYRRPPPVPAEQAGSLNIPRSLRGAALFGSDLRGNCKPADLAEYLDTFPLLPFPTDLVLHAGEVAYLVRKAARIWEQHGTSAGTERGAEFPLEGPLSPWTKQLGRPPRWTGDTRVQREEGLIYLTNWRLIFTKKGAVDSILLADVRRLEYLRDVLACTVGERLNRSIFLADDAMQIGLCVARAVRDIGDLVRQS